MVASVGTINDGVDNARRTINNVKRWMEVVF
jgi:flavin-binding protein dodecin